jgi:uncharacterized protein
MSLSVPAKPRLWIWLVWLAGFYASWTYLVFGLHQWSEVVTHWPISLAMAAGGYVAGATPMGGGTVGFPILVLLFDQPASMGRDFSFAVQSIGMVSASIFIISRRQPLAWTMLKGSMVGSLIGTPVGIAWVAPYVPALMIKVVFAVVWASFGVLHLYRIAEISGHTGMTESDEKWDWRVGLAVGFFAGLSVTAVTGVGIDMVLYTVLVLLCRADLKIAIPSSVVIMGFSSLTGIVFKNLTTGLQPGVYENWLAAAPVVALGAPLGAFIVDLIGRRPTLYFVAVLCVGQFAWMCYDERAALGVSGMLGCLGAVAAGLWGFEKLRAWGARLAGGATTR